MSTTHHMSAYFLPLAGRACFRFLNSGVPTRYASDRLFCSVICILRVLSRNVGIVPRRKRCRNHPCAKDTYGAQVDWPKTEFGIDSGQDWVSSLCSLCDSPDSRGGALCGTVPSELAVGAAVDTCIRTIVLHVTFLTTTTTFAFCQLTLCRDRALFDEVLSGIAFVTFAYLLVLAILGNVTHLPASLARTHFCSVQSMFVVCIRSRWHDRFERCD